MSVFSNINMVQQPKKLSITLFPHQLACIYNMEKLETNEPIITDEYTKQTKIGINGDATGYGKTLSMIGLIIRDKMEWDLDLPYVEEIITTEANGLIRTRIFKRYDKLPCTLILVSQSIIGQWEKELDKTELKYTSIISKKYLDNLNINDYDVILTIPTMYNKLILDYKNYVWKRFIFDEPGHLRVASMKQIKAGFYWFVTATPNSIVFYHKDCKGFMKDILSPCWFDFNKHFNDILIQNDPEFVKESFSLPVINNYYYDCLQPVFNTISDFVSDNIKSMIEANDIVGAISVLGGGKSSNIIELIKDKKTKEINDINNKLIFYGNRNDQEKIEFYTDKKEHILKQLEEIDKRFNDMINGTCYICYENITEPVMEYNCQTILCGKCLLKWLQCNKSCPLCRHNIDSKSLIYIDNKSHQSEKCLDKINEPRILTKNEQIIDIINKNKNGSFLIFSNYDNSFKSICNVLDENNIQFAQIKGNIKTRERNINLFKTKAIPVIFLNSNYNSAGINLQEATDIIIYHNMSDSTKNQIIGRAQRIGRKLPLNVHHLYKNIE